MSEKRAKQVRKLDTRLDGLERRLCAVEERRTADDRWNHALYHVQATAASVEARAAAKRQARQAERTARIWKRIAYVSLVAAIIVEIIAIWAVRNKEPEVPPLVVTTEQQAVSMTADAPRIGAPTLAQLLEG